MSDAPPKPLALDWEDGTSFLECFDEGPTRRIHAECSKEDLPEIGALCPLLLRLKDRDAEFQMHGTLAKYEEGIATFELLAEERMRHELVLVAARGESLPYRRRRHTRVPCHFSARAVGANGESVAAQVTTFGGGGTHLRLDEPFAIEERIDMVITVANGKRLELSGRVTSCIEDGPERGSSVEFLFRSAAQRDEVAALAAELFASSQKGQ